MFPAYAGVFLPLFLLVRIIFRVPRIRGGVPIAIAGFLAANPCSPHTRGCSRIDELKDEERMVFPAYAGVFLSMSSADISKLRVPRIRGGVPTAYS